MGLCGGGTVIVAKEVAIDKKESEMEVRKVSEIVYRTDLYPRINHDPALAQRYGGNLEVLPAIEVNQHNELIDGWHRWTAHRKADAETISVKVTPTKSDSEFLKLAIERNSNHGKQLEESDKKSMAIRLYNAGTGESKEEIARVLSVTPRSISGYLSDIEKQLREERKQKIFDLWMSCHTQEEIADQTGTPQRTIGDEISTFSEIGNVSNFAKSRNLVTDCSLRRPCLIGYFFLCVARHPQVENLLLAFLAQLLFDIA